MAPPDKDQSKSKGGNSEEAKKSEKGEKGENEKEIVSIEEENKERILKSPICFAVEDIVKNVDLISKAVESDTTRLLNRVLRTNALAKNKVPHEYIIKLASFFCKSSSKVALLAENISLLLKDLPAFDDDTINMKEEFLAGLRKEAGLDAFISKSNDSMVEESKNTSTSSGGGIEKVSLNENKPNEKQKKAKKRIDELKIIVETPSTIYEKLVTELSSFTNVDKNNNANGKRIPIEILTYLILLTITRLLSYNEIAKAQTLTNDVMASFVGKSAIYSSIFEGTMNKRTMQLFSSKILGHWYNLNSHPSLPTTATTLSPGAIRSTLFTLHRTATLLHNEFGQAVIINFLLRSFLQSHLIEQAAQLVARVTFPDHVSNNQLCRYLYYCGRIAAIQLDYSDAFTKLGQSQRKTPVYGATTTESGIKTTSATSASATDLNLTYNDGNLLFRLATTKLLLIVQLLLGEIPDRKVFSNPETKGALIPYLELTKAIRTGDLRAFNDVVNGQYTSVFAEDGNLTLIARLQHNVVKTGLRKISISYRRISLQDIAERLHLPSTSSAEFVVSKSIKDGVIEATIDHEAGFLQTKDQHDVYATCEPQRVFHKRISFCLDLYNETIKAMRYPPDAYDKEEVDTGDNINEEELQKEIDEMEEDEDY